MLGRGRGFAFVELIIIAVVLATVASVVAVGGRQNRLGGGLAGSMANLKKLAGVTASYGADFEDRLWTFSWKAGDSLSQYADLNDAASDVQAAANQAVDIFRRRFDEDAFPRINSWLPHVNTSTVVLADYLDEQLPMEWVASPGDRHLLEWQRDPYALGHPTNMRRAFTSSYLMPTAFASPDDYPTITQGSSYAVWQVPGDVELGGRLVREVAFPCHKVLLSESASWFFGPRPAWYLTPEARVPVLMMDGSAAVRRTSDANAAWHPADPARDDYFIEYRPRQAYEVPSLDPAGDTLSGKYRWSRHGLGGVDFDGERAE
jgi:hypothetical protein